MTPTFDDEGEASKRGASGYASDKAPSYARSLGECYEVIGLDRGDSVGEGWSPGGVAGACLAGLCSVRGAPLCIYRMAP